MMSCKPRREDEHVMSTPEGRARKIGNEDKQKEREASSEDREEAEGKVFEDVDARRAQLQLKRRVPVPSPVTKRRRLLANIMNASFNRA
jgi:hypothetical protein